MKHYYLLASLLLAQLAAWGQNVGIGTTAPTQALDVNGQLRVRGLAGAGGGLPQVQADGTLGLYSPAYSAASDPYAAQPVLLNPNPAGGTTGGTATGDSPNSVIVRGTTAYVVSGASRTTAGMLQVFDVSTPARPVLKGFVNTGNSPNSIAVSGTTVYVVNFDSNTLQVFDVSTPNPTLKGSVGTGAGSYPISVAVSGPTAYVVDYGSNMLQAFDVSTPTNPTLKGAVGTGAGSYPTSVALSGITAYVVSSNTNTLQVFDLGTSNPTLKGSVSIGAGSYPASVAVSGTTAYVVNYGASTLQVFDVAPANPLLLGTVSTGAYSSPTSVAVSGPTAYVTSYSANTLQVFDVSTPASPVLKGSVGTDRQPNSIAVSGPTAYVVNIGANTLQALQVGGGVRALGLQANGSLGPASAPLLTLSGQNLSISGGNTVTLPTQPGDDLGSHTATQNLNLAGYQLVGQGGGQGLSINAYGRVGIGTSSPASLLANTSDNVIGSDGIGVYIPSLTWASSQQGYAGAFYNAATGYGSNGLAVKVADNSSAATALDISRGSVAAVGTPLLRVRADGNVGIGTSSPAATLDVAGSTRLRGLTTAGVVTTDASGNLSSVVASSLGDNLGNHTAAQNLNLAGYQLVGQGGSQGLSISSAGRVGIGTGSPAATLDVAGYTRLAGAGVPVGASGASVPAVAVLALDATLPIVAGGQAFLAHGLSDANIVSVTALATGAGGNTIPPGFTLNTNGELYGVYLNGNRVVLQTGPAGTSAGVLGKAVRVFLTYRQ